jgi:hypothetical protein
MRMLPCFRTVLGSALLMLLGTSLAAAAVPSAANSTVPPCLVACPYGDIPFDVVVRDLANNPVANSSVVIDFANCPAAFICTAPGSQPDPYTVNLPARTIQLLSNASGLAHFPLRVGGGCAAGTVRVFADGVLIAQRALASPDQDGDGFTSNILNNDAALFSAKLGTTDPTADLDCDGDVDVDDESIFYRHASKTCTGFVDAAHRSTWGHLKTHYR